MAIIAFYAFYANLEKQRCMNTIWPNTDKLQNESPESVAWDDNSMKFAYFIACRMVMPWKCVDFE